MTDETRTDKLFAAHRLKDEGREYFECNDSGCGDRGPTVVDEDGCCAYCGSQARIVHPDLA